MKPLAIPVGYDGVTQNPPHKKSARLMQTSGLFYDSIGLSQFIDAVHAANRSRSLPD
jgi:hypothetical protein